MRRRRSGNEVTDMANEIKMVQRRAHETRDRIIRAAMGLISDRGYFAVTTNEVARQAGVSVGSLYSYFSDKKALMIACAARYHEMVRDSIETASFEQAPGQEGPLPPCQDARLSSVRDDSFASCLRDAIESVFMAHRIMPGFHQAMRAACLQDADLREIEARQNDESRQRVLALLRRWEPVIVPSDIPLAADLVYLLISETVHGYRDEGIGHDEERLVEELTRMIRLYLFAQ
jgi:AcrR family transcriptional regulator